MDVIKKSRIQMVINFFFLSRGVYLERADCLYITLLQACMLYANSPPSHLNFFLLVKLSGARTCVLPGQSCTCSHLAPL